MIWCALVSDLYAPFNPAIHCTDAAEILSLSIEHTESEAATIEVERSQRGWLDLIYDGPRNLLVSESESGLPADAVVIARGRINKLPSQVMGETQTLSAICAPSDLKDRLLTFAKANLTEGTDFRFSDEDPEDPASYLSTRSAVFYVDPATHDISISDDLVGQATHVLDDIALIGDEGPEESDGIYGEPVATLRAKLTLGWTETRAGTIDIAAQIGNVTSLDPDVAGRIATSIVSAGSEGWSVLPAGVDITTTSDVQGAATGGTDLGSVYKVTRKDQVESEQVVRDIGQNILATIRTRTPSFVEDGFRSGRALFRIFHNRVRRFLVGYAYEQDRTETLFAALTVPVRPQIVFADESEVIEFSIDDLFGDPDAAEYRSGREYETGDEVYYNGSYWRAKEDHYSEFFEERRPDGTSYWAPYTPDTGFSPNGLTRVLDADRGRDIVDHVFRRLWTEGRRRARFRHFSVPVYWDDTRDISLLDSVSLRVPTTPLNPGLFHRITGKVTRISRTWDPDGEQLAVVEFGISALFDMQAADPDAENVSWGVVGDPVEPPPRFAVRSVEVENQANLQLSKVVEVASSGGGRTAEDVSVVYPTRVRIRMHPIAARPTLQREVDATAFYTRADGGIAQG